MVREKLSWLVRQIKRPLKRHKLISRFLLDKKYIDLQTNNKNNPIKEILLVRLDDIGDYILFRDVLPFCKSYFSTRNYKITLCGNIVWKPLFDAFDANFIDDTIWIDKKQWGIEQYRKDIYDIIRAGCYESVLNCEYNRNQTLNDLIVFASKAPERLAWQGNINQGGEFIASINKGIYTKEFDDDEFRFEAERNKFLFEKWLHEPISSTKVPPIEYKNRKNQIVLFAGATKKSKRWSVHNFIKLANSLLLNYPTYTLVLAGDESDIERNKLIEHSIKGLILNTTGTTSLLTFAQLLASSKLLITNDTSALHIAAACHTSCIVVANGSNYWRFLSYPTSFSNVIVILPPPFQKLIETTKIIINKTSAGRSEINQINVEQVIDSVKEIL